jgi:K+-sensing histidine kinase KdpD
MAGFAAGVATGCLVGVTVTIVLLLFAAVWFGEPLREVVEASPRGIAAALAVILAVAGFSYVLHLPKAAAMLLFVSAVFLIADQLEILTALISSALSTIMIVFLFLPPTRSVRVAHIGDRVSLAVFLLVSVVGCRLICGRRTEESTDVRARSIEV